MMHLLFQVALYPHEMQMCVSHLPLSLEENQFREFLGQYGGIEHCFIMRRENEGDSIALREPFTYNVAVSRSVSSKGYGLVKFMHNRTKAEEVRRLLNEATLSGSKLKCDEVDSSIVRWRF